MKDISKELAWMLLILFFMILMPFISKDFPAWMPSNYKDYFLIFSEAILCLFLVLELD